MHKLNRVELSRAKLSIHLPSKREIIDYKNERKNEVNRLDVELLGLNNNDNTPSKERKMRRKHEIK